MYLIYSQVSLLGVHSATSMHFPLIYYRFPRKMTRFCPSFENTCAYTLKFSKKQIDNQEKFM